MDGMVWGSDPAWRGDATTNLYYFEVAQNKLERVNVYFIGFKLWEESCLHFKIFCMKEGLSISAFR